MNWTTLALRIVCWTARILALGLFLLWGAFFLEHVKEWFMHPGQESPPIWVGSRNLAHLAILLGLVALLEMAHWRRSRDDCRVAPLFRRTGDFDREHRPSLPSLGGVLSITIIPALFSLGSGLGTGPRG